MGLKQEPRGIGSLASLHNNRRGILAMLTAMFLFVANDALIKVVSASYPATQIMALRGLFASAFAVALVYLLGDGGRFRALLSPIVLLRAGLEVSVALLFISSLPHLPLANITAIGQAVPIILTLMAVAMGIERVGWRRWLAIVVGFLGVLLIVRPTPGDFNVYALAALASTILVAVRDLVTRSIDGGVPSSVVTLATTVSVCLAGFAFGATETWRPLAWRETLYLLGAAGLVTLGSLTIVIAFRIADVSVIGPLRYSVILHALLFGFVVFGEWPDPLAWAGIGLIAGSGIYTIHREQVRRREAALPETGAARRAA
jgi:drug/metabolite transporter (DMT)-like permease